jgi:hypothetical protein
MAMPKALLVLLGLTLIGAGVLHQRQQSLEQRYRTAQLHREIQKTQAKLWSQQVQIAAYTAPQVIQSMSAGVKADRRADSPADLDSARE